MAGNAVALGLDGREFEYRRIKAAMDAFPSRRGRDAKRLAKRGDDESARGIRVPGLGGIALEIGGYLVRLGKPQAGVLAEMVREIGHDLGPRGPRQKAWMEGVMTGPAFL